MKSINVNTVILLLICVYIYMLYIICVYVRKGVLVSLVPAEAKGVRFLRAGLLL